MFYRIIYLKDLLLLISKLGIWNVLYVFWYRISIHTGFRKLFFPTKELIINDKNPFKKSIKLLNQPKDWVDFHNDKAQGLFDGKLEYFFSTRIENGNPPRWNTNPFNQKQVDNNFHWTETKEFGLNSGDIKILWEPSRFYWLTDLALAYKYTGNIKYLNLMNSWFYDWVKGNPYNLGVNWRCGQEVSVRVINILLSLTILKQELQYNLSIESFLLKHLTRIESNILYAIAQDNNHGVSEAAGLFLGGVWLERNSKRHKKNGKKFKRKGIKWLENRLNKLVSGDGSFSQHSVNYHRILVDLITIVEFWNKKFNMNSFSKSFYQKSDSCISWLENLIDQKTGKAPNLGANDGARILNLHSCDYSDFRPTIQTARKVISNYVRFKPGPWDEPSFILGLGQKFELKTISKRSLILDNSYAIIYGDSKTWSMLRLPKFKFRPKHNDVLHFDLWYKGMNIMCDAGSYSYFDDYGEKFKSVDFHNTVSFGNRDQMERFSKFLLKNWIDSNDVDQLNSKSLRCSYRDRRNNFHQRSIEYKENFWIIEDTLDSIEKTVEIIWNIKDPIIRRSKEENIIETEFVIIEFKNVETFYLETSNVSEYYNVLSPITKVKLAAGKSKKVSTMITLKR